MGKNHKEKAVAICIHTGLELPPNVANDPRKRKDHYRYHLSTGKWQTMRGDYQTICEAAHKANRARGVSSYSAKSVRFWVDRYVKWMEGQNPSLANKPSWRNRVSSLRTFAKEQHKTEIRRITVGSLSAWWDTLTFDQQHNRRSNYSQFFQWAMAQGITGCNPFNTSDAIPHLIVKKKPAKRRLPIKDMEEFWAIYEKAEDFVQVAMMISLTTTMRAGDVAALKFSDVVNNHLQRTIAKSANQRGVMAATHHGWDLSEHKLLAKAINRGRELAFSRFGGSPYIVNKESNTPKRRKDCDHQSQVTANDLSRGFARAVKATGRWERLPEGRTPPTFHEVRGLILDLLLKHDVDIHAVQRLAAHTDAAVTSGYTANHPPQFREVDVVVDEGVLG